MCWFFFSVIRLVGPVNFLAKPAYQSRGVRIHFYPTVFILPVTVPWYLLEKSQSSCRSIWLPTLMNFDFDWPSGVKGRWSGGGEFGGGVLLIYGHQFVVTKLTSTGVLPWNSFAFESYFANGDDYLPGIVSQFRIISWYCSSESANFEHTK